MTTFLIILAYLVAGMFFGAALKYKWPQEFEDESDTLIPITIFWPFGIVVFLVYIIVAKGLAWVLDVMVMIIGMAIEGCKSMANTKLPKVRWK